MTLDRRLVLRSLAAAAASTWLGAPRAQVPAGTAQIVVGFPAGTTPDVLARKVAERLSKGYASAVVVDNRSGAGGQIAVSAVKGAPADGNNILLTPMSPLGVYPHTYKKLPYDPVADLLPVAMGASFDYGIGVGPAVPESVTDIRGLLAWAKADPTRASFGSPATGSTLHFVIEVLGRSAGMPITHVGYRGSGPAIQDMLGGNLPGLCAPLGSFLNQPKLRVLATSGAKRSRFTPTVATLAEQGFPDMVYSEWYGFFVPARTPAERIRTLNAALREAIASPDVGASLATFAMEATPSSPDELARSLSDETRRWGAVVKTIGFTAES